MKACAPFGKESLLARRFYGNTFEMDDMRAKAVDELFPAGSHGIDVDAAPTCVKSHNQQFFG